MATDQPNDRRVTDAPVLRGVQMPDIRPVSPDELEACAAIWAIAINEYIVRLNQPEIPPEAVGIMGLLRHTQATDPDRFLVAVRSDPTDTAPDAVRIVGFVSAVERGTHWFLSMLFVLPEEQGSGIGRELLERVLPDPARGLTLGTATDSAQPISNALYSRYGMVPRMPLMDLSGELRRPESMPPLPPGVTVTPFEAFVASGTSDTGGPGGARGDGHRELASIVNALDLATLGAEHPQDHAYLRTAGRRGFLFRAADGGILGYGYGSEVGRFGPVAVLDEALLAPVLAHLMRTIVSRGAYAVWTPGAAGDTIRMLLDAGLRMDPFPILLCWDEPATDHSRYLPISPGLL